MASVFRSMLIRLADTVANGKWTRGQAMATKSTLMVLSTEATLWMESRTGLVCTSGQKTRRGASSVTSTLATGLLAKCTVKAASFIAIAAS